VQYRAHVDKLSDRIGLDPKFGLCQMLRLVPDFVCSYSTANLVAFIVANIVYGQ